MKEKLQELMRQEGLRASQLAELLEVNPAGISHILAGRNKPGFELLQKILRRFPRLNPDWLLLDSEQMYRNDKPLETAVERHDTDSLPFAAGAMRMEPELPTTAEESDQTEHETGSGPQQVAAFPLSELASCPDESRHAEIERIVVFYSDRTFACYTPSKH